jgi:hypothetical protein
MSKSRFGVGVIYTDTDIDAEVVRSDTGSRPPLDADGHAPSRSPCSALSPTE